MSTVYRFDPSELLSAYRTVKKFFPTLKKLLNPDGRGAARYLKGVYIAPHPQDNTLVLVYTLTPEVCYRTEVRIHGTVASGSIRDLFIDSGSLRDFEAFLKAATEGVGCVRATLPTSEWSTRVEWGSFRRSIFTTDLDGIISMYRINCGSLFLDTRPVNRPVIVEEGDLSDIPDYVCHSMQKAGVTPAEILVETESSADYNGDHSPLCVFITMENGDRLTTIRVESEVR